MIPIVIIATGIFRRVASDIGHRADGQGDDIDVAAQGIGGGDGELVGLADLIVDVVDTGNTLKANGLRPLEKIADISSRLVVNKASMKRKHARVQGFIEQLAEAVRQQQEQAA